MQRNLPSIDRKEHDYSPRSKVRSPVFYGRKEHNSGCLKMVVP